MYTVKSGYWLETHLPGHINGFDPPPGQVELKNAVWKLQTAPKLKHFLWRLITKTIAVGSIMVTRRITDDPTCKRCCVNDETLDHLFFGCLHSQAIWRGTQVLHSAFFNTNLSFEEKLKVIIQSCNDKRLHSLTRQIPLWTLWRIWKSCNYLVYQHKSRD